MKLKDLEGWTIAKINEWRKGSLELILSKKDEEIKIQIVADNYHKTCIELFINKVTETKRTITEEHKERLT